MDYPTVHIFPAITSGILHHVIRDAVGMSHAEVFIEENTDKVIKVAGIQIANHAKLC